MKSCNFYSFTKRELESGEKRERIVDHREDFLAWNAIWDIWSQSDEDREMAREERMYY